MTDGSAGRTTGQRKGCSRRLLLLIVIGLLVLAVVLLLVVRATTRPEEVTPGWRPPTAVPRSTIIPADRLAFDSDRTGNFEIYTMPLTGGQPLALTNDKAFDSWSARISPDRRTILFYRTPAGVHDTDAAKASLWMMGADGSGLTEVRPAGLDGWVFQGHAEWSPDGGSLVMFGGSRVSPQIFVTSNLGGNPRPLTDRPGVNLDPVYSRDGRHIAFVGCPQAVCRDTDYEIYRIPVAGGEATRLTNDSLRDHDPMWSPDGRVLSWLTAFGGDGVGVWDVRIAGRTGVKPRRLVGDNGITSRPQFSEDGTFVYFHRVAPGRAKFDIYRAKIDGSGLQELTVGQPGNNEYPAP